jgi:flagellar basal-body rod protein FlgC
MSDLFNTMMHSAAGMRVQAERLNHVSENVSNADTPGYRRKVIDFEQAHGAGLRAGTVTSGPVRLDPGPLEQIHDPGHPLADAAGNYAGSNVDLVMEIADAREAQRSYEANLRMFDQARGMTSRLLDLLRR